MSNPVFYDTPKNQWTKIATNVISGTVHKLKNSSYMQTYRLTGAAAPTLASDGVKMFQENSFQESISHPQGIDVYVYCKILDGRVRIDV